MKIMLSCAVGMSTGMLVEKMRQKAEESGKKYEIWAIDSTSIDKYEGEFDVLLLGPQISYMYDEINAKYGSTVPVAVIRPIDYGRLNGAAVLKMAEQLMENRK